MKEKLAVILFVLSVAAVTVLAADNFVRGYKFDGETGLKTGAQLEDLITKSYFTTNCTSGTNKLFDGISLILDTSGAYPFLVVCPTQSITKLTVNTIDMTPQKSETINLTNSNTDVENQALIDAAGKYIPIDQTLTFQFGAGTYTNSTVPYTFDGFYGGGKYRVLGWTNTFQSTNQTVFIDGTLLTNDVDVMRFKDNACDFEVKGIAAKGTFSSVNGGVFDMEKCSSFGRFLYCFGWNTGTNFGTGFRTLHGGAMETKTCIVIGGLYGYEADNLGHLGILSCTNLSTQPHYGVAARDAGIAGINSSTAPASYPTGAAADKFETTGGHVFP